MGSDRLARALTRRRIVSLCASAAVPYLLVAGLGHRGIHAARNLLVPGAGLFGEATLVGVVFVVLAIVATVGWVQWGTDWAVAAVVTASIVWSIVVTPAADHHLAGGVLTVSRASHEFPLVMLVIAAWQWFRRLPLINRIRRRQGPERHGLDSLEQLSCVDRCRTISLLALAGEVPAEAAATLDAPDVIKRARRIALVARGRRGAQALEHDQAPLRTARHLVGHGHDLRTDARHQLAGVPASVPGWITLLDGTLAAIALERDGVDDLVPRWRTTLERRFHLHRRRRASTMWAPLGVALGAATPWEHAAATALARGYGWLDHTDDWTALRPAALGAAARGTQRPDDERLVAAARLWLRYVDDPEADRILHRVTVRRDPLAVALDRLASLRTSAAT